jgi:hypothetical protein
MDIRSGQRLAWDNKVAGSTGEISPETVRKWQDGTYGNGGADTAAHHPVATRAVRGMAGLPGLEGPECVILARLRAW